MKAQAAAATRNTTTSLTEGDLHKRIARGDYGMGAWAAQSYDDVTHIMARVEGIHADTLIAEYDHTTQVLEMLR